VDHHHRLLLDHCEEARVVGIVPVICLYDVDVVISVTVNDNNHGDKRKIVTVEVPVNVQGTHGISWIIHDAVRQANTKLDEYVETLARQEETRLR
jgi:hypothetical protein